MPVTAVRWGCVSSSVGLDGVAGVAPAPTASGAAWSDLTRLRARAPAAASALELPGAVSFAISQQIFIKPRLLVLRDTRQCLDAANAMAST